MNATDPRGLAPDERGPVNEKALRAYFERILGWSDERRQDIEHALHVVRLSVTQRTTLLLVGALDLVPIALEIHRRALGGGRPFVVCDPRRRSVSASVRAPANYELGVAAFRAAFGGSLCVRRKRMPADLSAMAALLRDPHAPVTFIVCAERFSLDPFLLLPAPIQVPPIGARASELPRIVDAYAYDAVEELAAHETGFTPADRDWILEHAASSLPEIEKGTRRLVAIRQAGSVSGAAVQLGISHVALIQWLGRRRRRGTGKGGQSARPGA